MEIDYMDSFRHKRIKTMRLRILDVCAGQIEEDEETGKTYEVFEDDMCFLANVFIKSRIVFINAVIEESEIEKNWVKE